MLRLLRVTDAAGRLIANKVNRNTDGTKSFVELYNDLDDEFTLNRPLLSVKLLEHGNAALGQSQGCKAVTGL